VQNRYLLGKNWPKRRTSYDKKPRGYPCFLGYRTPFFRHISVHIETPFAIKYPYGKNNRAAGENRAEATASSTAHLLSLSRVRNLLFLTVVLVNLEYVVRMDAITKATSQKTKPFIQTVRAEEV
jgi:hypothetical protein